MTDATGSGYWSSVAEAWRAGRFHSLWRSHSDAVNAALCARWLPPGGVGNLLKTDLFDEMVGDGLYPTMASRARRVFGIDLSVTVASAAVARYPRLHALGADARHLPFADGSFGAVVSTSTLDHFQTPDDIVKSLREIHRVLRTGGCLLLTLDNGANPVVALRNAAPFQLLNCLGLVPYYVGTTYGPRGARRALEQAGFAVLEVDGIMHCPRACAVAVAWQLQRHGGARMQRIFLRTLMACELLAQWPTQFLSGYFVALRAVRH